MESNEKPVIGISGSVTLGDGTCEVNVDESVLDYENNDYFLRDFNLEGTEDTYVRIDVICDEHNITQEILDEVANSKDNTNPTKNAIIIDEVPFLNKNFFDEYNQSKA